jgi:hypothetical protein
MTDPFLASLIINIILLDFIFISLYTVEAVRRRPSLLVGSAVMGTCTSLIGVLGSIGGPLKSTASVSFCAIWVAAYALSGRVHWVSVWHA